MTGYLTGDPLKRRTSKDGEMPGQQHYDVVIIGSGAGGGTLAWKLAPSGKRILLLERGDYLPRERDNWDTDRGVHRVASTRPPRRGSTGDDDEFTPEQNYYVGGNTKFYGAALFRLRPEDFGEIRHHGGISPAWPLAYDDFEPWYARGRAAVPRARAGRRGSHRGPRSGPYPYPDGASTSRASSSSTTTSSSSGCIRRTCRSA